MIKLNTHITELIPKVDLTELLLEINEHTGFTEAFTHVSEANARANDLDTSICAVLLAEACNIGLEPLVKSNVPALTRHRLNWVKQNYIRTETLIQANARLVDHQATLSLAFLPDTFLTDCYLNEYKKKWLKHIISTVSCLLKFLCKDR